MSRVWLRSCNISRAMVIWSMRRALGWGLTRLQTRFSTRFCTGGTSETRKCMWSMPEPPRFKLLRRNLPSTLSTPMSVQRAVEKLRQHDEVDAHVALPGLVYAVYGVLIEKE